MSSSHPHPSNASELADKSVDEPVIAFKPIEHLATGSQGSFFPEEEPHMLPASVAGGYCPLQLGQILHSAQGLKIDYEIVRKLGWGAASSVWLARYHTDRYAAIKVMSASASSTNHYQYAFENDFTKKLREIAGTEAAPPGNEHCVNPSDLFFIESKHGFHYCIPQEPHSMSVEQLMWNYRYLKGHCNGLGIATGKSFTRQVLSALNCVHALGYIHVDVKTANVFVAIPAPQDSHIEKFLQENPPSMYVPRTDPSISPDPITTVVSEPLPVFQEEDFPPEDLVVRLGDFSEVLPFDKADIRPLVMPELFRAPEVILGHKLGPALDVWALGFFVLDIVIGELTEMFYMNDAQRSRYNATRLAQLQTLLGPFPTSFLDRCSKRSEFFSEDGLLLDSSSHSGELGSLREVLEKAGIRGADLDELEAFLRRCLQLDPALRPPASELLQDIWFHLHQGL